MNRSLNAAFVVTAFGCFLAVTLPTGAEVADTKPAEAKVKPVDFAKDVYPIFRRSCFECHGPEKQEGELRLDQRESTFDSGSIDVGKPAPGKFAAPIDIWVTPKKTDD